MPTQLGELTFYTVEELASVFKVSPATVYEYIKSGRLPAARFGRKYQITQAGLERFFASQAESAGARP